MQHRSPAAVFFLSLITFGIYALVWQVKTKGELNRLGADIPTAWLLIIPFANLYWIWKYCEGVEQVSGGQISAVLALILILLLSIIGFAILQSEFNKLNLQPAAPGAGPDPGTQPLAGSTPTPPVGPDPLSDMPPAPSPGIGGSAPGTPGPTTFAPDKPGGSVDTPPSPPTPLVQ